MAGYGRVFLRFEGEQLHEFVVESAVNSPGFEEFCSHQYDIGRKAAAWCRAAERYYWPLGEEPKRDKAAFDWNAEQASDAQTRIKSAYEWLCSQGQWPGTVTAQLRKLSQIAKTSLSTLYKYSHLWKPFKQGVIDQPASNTADPNTHRADTADPPNPLPDGLLHPVDPITKGVTMRNAPKSLSSKEKGGDARGGKGFPQAEGGC